MHANMSRLIGTLFVHLIASAGAFHSSSFRSSTTFLSRPPLQHRRIHSPCFVSSSKSESSSLVADGDSDNENVEGEMSDEELLAQTPMAQLIDLCQQFSISTEESSTKLDLLERLRNHAAKQAEMERQRLEERRRRVEEGSDDGRERFEFLEGDADDEEDEAVFYYPSTVWEPKPVIHTTAANNSDDSKDNNSKDDIARNKKPVDMMNSQAKLTSPPPPPIEPDENGERVVTVYSTTDMNDLTGVAAAQPGQASRKDPMLAGAMADPVDAPWDANNPQKRTRDPATMDEVEKAKSEVTDLVSTLLSMSGAPGFQQDEDDELSAMLGGNIVRRPTAYTGPEGFVGFDPSIVPTEMLMKASKSLRTGRGTVLSEVLRDFEIRAVGYDGAAGDNTDRGGGHYRQVSKVRSFLEGYRRAEVRRLARETATMLLDKLVSEGIEGLDMALATMTRSSDETGDEAGELNDSILDYLNESVRQQEKKVEQLINSVKKVEELEKAVIDTKSEDIIDRLWSIEANTEDGRRIETFDPNNKDNKRALQDELARQSQPQSTMKPVAPKSAPEQLLLLLKLLRERIKTEAAFSHDEKSRNLRVLAYCLNMDSDQLRRDLIVREFGASLDRLDSFAELVASSVEYAESTSHQLQPSKYGPLNVTILKRVQALTNEIRERLAWKASGAKSSQLKP